MVLINDKGREFLIRIVREGAAYGSGDALTHDKPDPLVEFYDLGTRKLGGQFISRYYASTLAHHVPGAGLCLQGGVPAWDIDGPSLLPLLDRLRDARIGDAECCACGLRFTSGYGRKAKRAICVSCERDGL